jgi:hypothetical protein
VIVPLTLAEAKAFVRRHHRHNEPPISHKFSIGLRDGEELIGVVMAGRPVARMSDDGLTLEVYRLTTRGDRNACSRLYAVACRAAAPMGYHRVLTYTLVDESGVSLRASGFREDGRHNGHPGWKRTDGTLQTVDRMTLFEGPKMPTGPKVRWVRWLVPEST